MEGWLSEAELHENPLVPNNKLRQMYLAMAEARALDDHIVKLLGPSRRLRGFDSVRGQEAARVSTVIDLLPGDLVSDSQPGFVMDLLTGTKTNSLLERVATLSSGKKTKKARTSVVSGRLLPWIDDPGERLRMSMGAALSFKVLGRPHVVVAYVRHGSVSKGDWRRILSLASKLELPVIFIVLPSAKRQKTGDHENLSNEARRWGVPGIPVDAADAVALYRVAQESLGRSRGGDGPILIECLAFLKKAKGRDTAPDPLVLLADSLVRRNICTKAWLEKTGNGLRRRIQATRR
jgi:TPP-dependent pyruvate/acetoin dehydrogenase alpha subunit